MWPEQLSDSLGDVHCTFQDGCSQFAYDSLPDEQKKWWGEGFLSLFVLLIRVLGT